MTDMFSAVFDSVWKRKETKIFLAFALYPLVFYIANLFPDSEFMKIYVEDSYRIGLLESFNMLFGTVNSLTLPVLALYYLTYTVFRKELDNSLMFLYKDLERRKIFWHKLASLLSLVLLFIGISFFATVIAHYFSIVYQPYGSYAIFPETLSETIQILISIAITALDFILSVFIAMLMSLYCSIGVTMVASLVIGILTSILPLFGGEISLIYPTGYSTMLFEGELVMVVVGILVVSTFYVIVASAISLNKFKEMEF